MSDLQLTQRYRLQLGNFERVQIVQVGCGGTGSFLALHLARLAYHCREQHGLAMRVILVDPDTVETKNIGRQNFCPAEVGQNKAQALMLRLNRAFGLAFQARDMPFDREIGGIKGGGQTLWLLVGCVDTGTARSELAAKATQMGGYWWWLDCGNHEHSGQVLLGNRTNLTAPDISPLGFCAGLPLPSVQHPELLAAPSPAEPAPESCADLALREAQSLMINQAVAGWAAQYIYRMVVARDLDLYATYVDLATGSARSVAIVRDDRPTSQPLPVNN